LEEQHNMDLHHNPRLNFSRFQSLLKGMEMRDEELLTLFNQIDANRDGVLQIREFIKGLQYFAPSVVLEDLRLLCLQQYEDLAEAFETVDRLTPMNLEQFRTAMESRKLRPESDEELDAVFAMLDFRNEGSVTFGKLIAAMQAGGPGSRIRLPSEERDQRAASDVRSCLLPTAKLIGEVKTQARLKEEAPRSTDDSHDLNDSSGKDNTGSMKDFSGGHRSRTSSSPGRIRGSKRQDGTALTLQAWNQKEGKNNPNSPAQNGNQESSGSGANAPGATGDEEGGDVPVHLTNVAPRLRALAPDDLAKYMNKLDDGRIMQHKKFAEDPVLGSQKSWSSVWQCFHQSPDQKERVDVEKQLLNYFQTAATKMSQDTPYLERSHSRYAIYRSVRAHTRALARK
jgi:Ca2+-binding EF-hand superfamily protein